MAGGSTSEPGDSLGSDVLDLGIPREGMCVCARAHARQSERESCTCVYMCVCMCVHVCVYVHLVPVIRGMSERQPH